jgi:hypothetical protein
MGDEMMFKPTINLADLYGDNVYYVVGCCQNVLNDLTWEKTADHLFQRMKLCKSYDAVFIMLSEYFENSGSDEP